VNKDPKSAESFAERHFLRQMRKRKDVQESMTKEAHLSLRDSRRAQRENIQVEDKEEYNNLRNSKSRNEVLAIWRKFPNDLAITSAAISKLGKLGALDAALEQFEDFKYRKNSPDLVVYGAVISACSWAQRVAPAEMYWKEMIERGFQLNSIILTSLMRLYMYKYPSRAVEIFESHKEEMVKKRELVALAFALAVYKRAGLLRKLEDLYNEICAMGFQLTPTQLSPVLWLYSCTKDFESASRLWKTMKRSPDFVYHPHLFEFYAHVLAEKADKEEMFKLKLEIEQMGVAPSTVFLGCWFECLYKTSDVELGDREFDHALKESLVDLEHYSTCRSKGERKHEERIDFHDCSVGMAFFAWRFILRDFCSKWKAGDRSFADFPLKMQTGNGPVLEKLCEQIEQTPPLRYRFILNRNKTKVGLVVHEDSLKAWLEETTGECVF